VVGGAQFLVGPAAALDLEVALQSEALASWEKETTVVDR
jgi:hypothetical protein